MKKKNALWMALITWIQLKCELLALCHTCIHTCIHTTYYICPYAHMYIVLYNCIVGLQELSWLVMWNFNILHGRMN